MRMVITRRRYEGPLPHKVVNELDARQNDVIALSNTKSTTMWVSRSGGDEVTLHVDDEERIVLGDTVHTCWRVCTQQLEVPLEYR